MLVFREKKQSQSFRKIQKKKKRKIMSFLNFSEIIQPSRTNRSIPFQKITALNAIQLYKSATNTISTHTQEISKPMCRICMSTSSKDLLTCPCHCSGSIGFIHENCLKRWKFVRNDSFCEICKARFNIQRSKTNFWRLFKNFFQRKYFGFILRNFIELMAVCPLLYINVNNLKNFIETSEISSDLFFSPIFLFSGYFFYKFVVVAKENLSIMRMVLRLWWIDEDFLEDGESSISLSDDEDLFEL